MDELVLIVDDNPSNLKLLRVVLEKAGFETLTAIDASEAARMLETFLVGVILMDVQLPGRDGLALTRDIKRNPRMAHVKIIAVTASAMPEDEQRAKEAGCDAYVTKPIDTEALPLLVAKFLVRA